MFRGGVVAPPPQSLGVFMSVTKKLLAHCAKQVLNKWEGKDKQWETLRFPQWFDLIPKQKFAKNKKHQKTNFEVSNVDMVLAAFLRIMHFTT